MNHSGKKADMTLRQVVQKRCELIIALRAEATKAGSGTRCRGLVGRVRGGKGTTCPPRGT
jgi:hypothetical protein